MAVKITISIDQNSQSVSANTSNVTVTVRASWTYGSYNLLQKSGWLKIDGTQYSFTSPFNTGQTTSGVCTLFTKTVNVKHASDGTKTLAVSASYTSGVSSGTVGASASKTLTMIPRKSTVSTPNGVLGTKQTLTVTRQSSSFTHTITYKCGTTSGTICTKSSSESISWTPPPALASQNTSGTSVSVTFTITTYSGSTSIGSNTKTITCTIPTTYKPSCRITLSDPTGIYDKYGSYVKELSRLKVIVTPTLSYGSGIKAYKTVVNGLTYTSASFTTGGLSSSGTYTITSTVTDKRGRSGSSSEEISVLNYSAPVISRLAVKRCNADGSENDRGEYIAVSVKASVSSLNNLNTATYTLKYKKSNDSSYTELPVVPDADSIYSIDEDSIVFPADSAHSYNIEFSVTDNHNTSSRTTTASTGFTLMHWNASGTGIGFGKLAELPNVFDVGFQTRFYGGILHIALEPETNLDDIRTPNTYIGENVSSNKYSSYYNGTLNFPLTSGTFTLEVVGMGDSGQVKQTLTYCHKTLTRAWERIYYSSSWGDWICVSDFAGTLLWDGSTLETGGYYMTAGHTVTLSEEISKQKSGIVLVFSEYVDGAAANQSFHCRFIPKMMASKHSGKAQCIQLVTSNLAYFATKYLYITDAQITGHANNNATGTGACGITYTNNRFVLRYVIGV